MRAEHISVRADGGKYLLQDLSLQVKMGEVLSILGKNGAGKSTLLKTITGEMPSSTGEVTYDDMPLSKIDMRKLAKKRAVISQNIRLEFSFSVAEVVALGRSPHNAYFDTTRDVNIVDECLSKVDAYHLRNRDYTTLSGGEQQRVQFARALAQIWEKVESREGGYLFLDEPLSNLDVSHQHEMMHIVRQLAKCRVAVFFILHDLNLAAQYSDRVCILKNGRLFSEGKPVEVFTEEIITEAFDYPVNVIPHPKIECPLIVSAY
jgi:iron complex transport system ATP-binding protein